MNVPRLIQIPLLMLVGCLIAGSFGALHNQVSYSVSPEYFTAFKFEQFHIPKFVSDRVGAAMVGWQAAWWMGIPIGMVLLPIGLFIRGNRAYFTTQLRAYLAVICATCVFSLAGLGIGFFFLSDSTIRPQARYGHEIEDDLAFCRAGVMHNFSYMGGMVGILCGCFVIAHARLGQLNSAAREADA